MNEAYAGPPPPWKRPRVGAYVYRTSNSWRSDIWRWSWFVGRSGAWFQMHGWVRIPGAVGRWAHERQIAEMEAYMKRGGVEP